jgi:hypothetical protein
LVKPPKVKARPPALWKKSKPSLKVAKVKPLQAKLLTARPLKAKRLKVKAKQ